MKKTILAFSVTITLSIGLFLVVALTGCDWFNTNILGKPSQEEIANNKLKAEQEKIHQDSLKAIELQLDNNLKEKLAAETANQNNGAFHIIVGCYEDKNNVDKMCTTLRNKNYHPVVFPLDGFTCVSAISYPTLAEAENQLENFLEYDFCPDDAWVYKK